MKQIKCMKVGRERYFMKNSLFVKYFYQFSFVRNYTVSASLFVCVWKGYMYAPSASKAVCV
jgi:hypothetical protein